MATVEGILCMYLRGGTSKAAFFLASDLPRNPDDRDDVLLRIMGTPDPRQIDGLGAPEDTAGVDARLAVHLQKIGAVAHQSACQDKITE